MGFLTHMYGISRERAGSLGPVNTDSPLPVRPFKDVLRDMAVIAEVKYATPGQGELGVTHDPAHLAREYESLGACAISCLTEPVYFSGDMAYIAQIRNACRLPVMMKDFIVDERQIAAGKACGADAFLLITEMLTFTECERLYTFGQDLGLDCLVEVHGMNGLEKALCIGGDIIGVNARDLSTLQVNSGRHEEMAGHIPHGIIKVAESGISSRQRLRELAEMGYDAALIGRAMANAQARRDVFSCG
jgi:indole-3-glycerol phosphate synthase